MARILIINADDLGYDPEITRGILVAMREGIVSSATLMVNTPYSEDAARQTHDLPIGLHFNLARGAPISKNFPKSLLSKGELSEAMADQLPPEVIEQEALAQLDRLETLVGGHATHVDVHKHLHLRENVMAGLCAAAAARGMPVRAINAGMRSKIGSKGLKTTDHFIGDAGAEPYWTLPRLLVAVEQLPDGITELMCHPGYAPIAVRSGYAQQREVELQTWTDPRARQCLQRAGVIVTHFGSLGAAGVATTASS